jgi:hypothetical protein
LKTYKNRRRETEGKKGKREENDAVDMAVEGIIGVVVTLLPSLIAAVLEEQAEHIGNPTCA